MRNLLKSIFFVGLALGITFWVLYVLDMTRYDRLGETHVLGEASIDVDRSLKDVYESLSGLSINDVEPSGEGEIEADTDASRQATNLSEGVSRLLGLPGLNRFGVASLLMVDHRQPDFLMYQERLDGVIFIHGIGLKEVEVGTTTVSWQVQSPNTQWWFHGSILHMASFFWGRELPQALKKAKELLEKT
ncbi:MAG: hypothetical protein HOI23_21650 [Deltaproteobacteria bacterium]|jgi:hypothetical protein|nr:hypothetical protein [Deltaproteobacteria bacterium]MBT6432262.1 hypothetical protein [Deltaproteobacteria bacterium]MBT6488626.1 hypothetical protein [Deltaproteobacteria bacterium]